MSTSAKILRPGSAFTGELPARRISAQPEHVAQNQEFATWEAAATAEQVKQRFISDPAFRRWYEGA